MLRKLRSDARVVSRIPTTARPDHLDGALTAARLSVKPSRKIEVVLEPCPVTTRAIELYSRPSDTLLLVYIDAAFKHTLEGAAWLMGVLKRNHGRGDPQILTGRLAEATAPALISEPPKSDDEMVLFVTGKWPDGMERDLVVAHRRFTDPPDFDFEASVPLSATDKR
jgi:hypothetical protein